MVQGLWDCQVNATIDVKLGDADADTYKYEQIMVKSVCSARDSG